MSVVDRPALAAKALVALLVAASAAYFSFYTCTSHALFHTYAYDLGTFDQGIWLAGHTTDAFVTVRGLPLLGDHVRVFSYVLAPLYWIVDDVRALLVLQSVAIALGGWFVWRIARRELPGSPWGAAAFAAAWLVHPANQNLNLDHAHPDAFATMFLLAAVDALRGGRTAAFAVAAALAMSCKEDVPLVFVAMGLAMMLDPARRRFGMKLAAAAGAYFALCMLVILPHFNNGIGFFRFGRSGFLSGVGRNAHDPAWFLARLTGGESLLYLARVAAPFAGLFLLAPLAVAPALPALAANLLSDASYMRSYDYHYLTSVVPFLMIGAIDATAFLAARGGTARVAAKVLPFVVLACTVAANVAWSKVPLTRLELVRDRYEALRDSRIVPKLNAALARIPRDAVVSAHYSLVPQLSHRRRIYLFPNPFQASNWGVIDENTHDPNDVEYVVLRNIPGRDPSTAAFEALPISEDFDRIDGDQDYALYRRRDLVPPAPGAWCGDWNADGRVTVDEVRLVAERILKKRECPPAVCDATGNGALGPDDALLLHKHSQDPAVPVSCPR